MIKVQGLKWGRAAVVAVCAAAFFTLIVPLQTYLANADLFDYSAWAVVWELLPWFAAWSVGLFVVFIVTGLVVGQFASVLTFALFLCGYLETGIFSIGLPPLDGDILTFSNPFRTMIDTGLILLFGGAVLCSYRWFKSTVHWCSLAVLILALASLLDVRPSEKGATRGELADGFCPQYDIVKSARFSPERNVIILILDTFRASMAADAVKACPDLKEHFPGFVAYGNNLAMHEMTSRALPALVTGKYLSPDQSASDYESTMFGTDSFLLPFVRNDRPVYFSDQLLPYGYTNRRMGNFSDETTFLTKTGSVLHQNSNLIPYVTLWDVVAFRIAPYKFKCRLISEACRKALAKAPSHRAEVYEEDRLFPALAAAPITNDTGTALLVFHTTGPHGPITRDRNGASLPAPTQDINAYKEYSIFVLRQVANLMDVLMKRGLYDKSYVILAADHGYVNSPALKRMERTNELLHHGADSSILWVKPFGAKTPYSTSTLPTSNCKVAELIRTLAARDLTQEESAEILHAKDRRFIAKFGTSWYSMGRYTDYSEWRYDDEGNVVEIRNLGIFKAN